MVECVTIGAATLYCGDMETKTLPGLSRYGIRADGEIESYWKENPSILVGGTDKDGYRKFVLIDDHGSRRYARRASLVCTAFHGPKEKGKEVRHLDGSRTNDAANNLAWATHKENISDKISHGTYQRGEQASHVKITQQQAEIAKRLWISGASIGTVMREAGVTRAIAYNIKYGNSWAWL